MARVLIDILKLNLKHISKLKAKELVFDRIKFLEQNLMKYKEFQKAEPLAQAVLVDLAYNLGLKGYLKLNKFRSKLQKYYSLGEFERKIVRQKHMIIISKELLSSKFCRNFTNLRCQRNAELLINSKVVASNHFDLKKYKEIYAEAKSFALNFQNLNFLSFK